MLKPFLKHFGVKSELQYSNNFYQDFFSQLGGRQFGNGLFNTFSLEDTGKWTAYIVNAFPNLEGKILPFAYSWGGICFCVDRRDGKIIVCDVGSGEVFAIPCSLKDFLNKEIPKKGKILLESHAYKKWLSKASAVTYGSCAGLKVPLFLGGDDDISNRELSDMEVYWSVLAQVKAQVMGQQ